MGGCISRPIVSSAKRCNNASGFHRGAMDERRQQVRVPDQPHTRGGGRQVEPADHSRYDVRQQTTLPRTAEIGGGHFLQYPRRSAADAARAGDHHQGRRSDAFAEVGLQSDRAGHPAAAGAGADGGLGTQVPASDRGTRYPGATAGGRRSQDVARLHGRAARTTSGCAPAPPRDFGHVAVARRP